MKTIYEFDVTDDLHSEIHANPNNVLVKYANGNSVRLSWNVVRALVKLTTEYDKKPDGDE